MPFQASIAIEEGESALCALAKTPQMFVCFQTWSYLSGIISAIMN